MPDKSNTAQSYKQHAAKVFRYAMFKLGKKEDAEDVVSETFTRYLAKPNAEIVNLELWLIGIARNVIYEKIKKGKYRELGFSVIDGQELELADTSRSLPVELTTSLQAALAKLDTDTREVIILKTWEELKFEEIADIMKLNTNTVKAKYYRGVEELKASINPPRDAQKVRSISTPLLLASIRMLAEAKEFTPDPEFLSSLKAQIGDKVNLINANQNMNKQLFKSKKFLATLAAIALVVVAGLVFITSQLANQQTSPTEQIPPVSVTPTEPAVAPNPCEGMSKYTNTEYKFQFCYPSRFTELGNVFISMLNPTSVTALGDAATAVPNSDSPWEGFGVSIDRNVQALSLDSYVDEVLKAERLRCEKIVTHQGGSVECPTGKRVSGTNSQETNYIALSEFNFTVMNYVGEDLTYYFMMPDKTIVGIRISREFNEFQFTVDTLASL